jgi:hypothetical protein
LDRNLLALSAALPEASYETLADWPLGRCNRALAQMLASWFGNESGADLQGWVACPRCREKLEFQMDSRPLTEASDPTPENPVTVNGRRFRLPTSRDLARVVREPDPELAAIRLLESCRLEADSFECSAEDLEHANEQLAWADPLAEIRVTVHCSNCAHAWDETLDLGAFVWAKIEALAKRLLREVHALAFAYGWTEREILSLTETRRSFYLGMVEA